MRIGLLLLLGAGVVACGGGDGKNFAGAWSGIITQSQQTCSDGSVGAPQSGTTTYQFTASGSTVTTPVACGATFSFEVDSSNTHATQQGTVTCPAAATNGFTVVSVFTNGSLMLNGNSMTIAFDGKNNITGAATGNCTYTIGGTLTRQ